MRIKDVPSLRSIDLNLLFLFDAVMQERNVTRASERIGMSQSALSHGLNRLRHMLNDDLFVRTPNGMIPTPTAERMSPFVQQALEALQAAVECRSFDPSSERRVFRIALNHYSVVVLAANLSQLVLSQAPKAQIHIQPSFALSASEVLDNDRLDLVVVRQADNCLGERFSVEVILEDRYVAITRAGSVVDAKQELCLSTIAAKPHLTISSIDDDTSFIDKALSRAGLSRNIAMSIPYLACAPVLIQSDMISIVTRRVADELASTYPIEIHDLPELSEIPLFRIIMIWHRRFDSVPAHHWLRRMLIDSVKPIMPRHP